MLSKINISLITSEGHREFKGAHIIKEFLLDQTINIESLIIVRNKVRASVRIKLLN